MRKHLFASALASLVIACAASACDQTTDPYGSNGGGGTGPCGRFTSCGSCTPVPGCGWCSTPDGRGLCADDPNECAGVPSFSWTWEPNGCFVGADAGIATRDAGAPGADARASDAGAASD